ncbi:hypothetical protein JTE90_008723 [Oedothorax gibbosus]|uniref:Uncharacterized protein n=1 Tax=Oedothorax gibbosus TaxID=931172 RepID=A0AAV6UR42_9ARAC|nr:hypothetical protein JTE90_008723 [Oedothorax gibbosus]
MGRTRGTLPTGKKLLNPQLIKNVLVNLQAKLENNKQYRDRGTKTEPPLSSACKKKKLEACYSNVDESYSTIFYSPDA